MTAWLWGIGTVAIFWPIIVALYLDHVFTKWLNLIESRSENASTAHQRAEAMRAEIVRIQTLVEQQDALLAALWEKTLGLCWRDDVGEYTLPEHLGIKPEWEGFHREWCGKPVYLTRFSDYPWRKSAPHLYFPDVTDLS